MGASGGGWRGQDSSNSRGTAGTQRPAVGGSPSRGPPPRRSVARIRCGARPLGPSPSALPVACVRRKTRCCRHPVSAGGSRNSQPRRTRLARASRRSAGSRSRRRRWPAMQDAGLPVGADKAGGIEAQSTRPGCCRPHRGARRPIADGAASGSRRPALRFCVFRPCPALPGMPACGSGKLIGPGRDALRQREGTALCPSSGSCRSHFRSFHPKLRSFRCACSTSTCTARGLPTSNGCRPSSRTAPIPSRERSGTGASTERAARCRRSRVKASAFTRRGIVESLGPDGQFSEADVPRPH